MPEINVSTPSPWGNLIDSLQPILQMMLGQPSGPIYPGPMAAGMAPAEQMAMQMMGMRSGGMMSQMMNPFGAPGYQVGDVGAMMGGGGSPYGKGGGGAGGGFPLPPAGGAGPGPPPNQVGYKGQSYGKGPDQVNAAGQPIRSPEGAEQDMPFWLKRMGDMPSPTNKAWQSAMQQFGPFYTPAVNPYMSWGGQSPGMKAQAFNPLAQDWMNMDAFIKEGADIIRGRGKGKEVVPFGELPSPGRAE